MPLFSAAPLALQLIFAGLLEPASLAAHARAALADGRGLEPALTAVQTVPKASNEAAAAIATPPAAAASDDEEEGDDEEGNVTEEAESEASTAAPAVADPGHPYSGDLTDAELKRRWTKELASVGSVSVGFADLGRLINGVHVPDDGDAWTCVRPDLAWGARETVDGLVAAFNQVHKQFPDSVPARLNHIGLRDGGWLRPHRSHQSGRDADIGFFYKNDVVPYGRGKREKTIDPARSWALVRALVTLADVQFVLVDRGIQNVLRKYALSIGEDQAWVDSLFRGGRTALIQHARRHRDHFHVRFYAPRSQELGRRITPLLAERPDQNLVLHKVKQGQTVGHIARQYKTTVAAVMKANHMRKSFLRVGQRLKIPLRGPCTRCPVVPALVVPGRRLPPVAVGARAVVGSD